MRENVTKITGLDSLRFFAFLSIFVFHATDIFPKGYLGVDFFFVLSSFLLTFLMLKELELTNTFSKKNFLVRRSLRIFPLYFLVVGFSLMLLPLLSSFTNTNISLPENQLLYWTFLSNYEFSDSIFALKFLWSIAVEEQFYLFFILFSFLFKRHFWIFISIVLIGYFSFIFSADYLNISTYTHTLTHFANFAAGMSAAYLFYHKKITLNTSKILLVAFLPTLFITNLPEILFHPFLSIVFAALILIFIPLSEKIQQNKVLKTTEHLGKYTYGLYIYSGFILTFGEKFIPIENLYAKFLIQLVLLIAIAFSSYHLFEKHFLKLKKRFY
ncbi:MAG: acyltransferase family protein [Vicingaceae bacterium]